MQKPTTLDQFSHTCQFSTDLNLGFSESFLLTTKITNSVCVLAFQTSLSNGFPVIVIRGLSDQAGAQEGQNPIDLFGPLAASNAAKAVVQFVKAL